MGKSREMIEKRKSLFVFFPHMACPMSFKYELHWEQTSFNDGVVLKHHHLLITGKEKSCNPEEQTQCICQVFLSKVVQSFNWHSALCGLFQIRSEWFFVFLNFLRCTRSSPSCNSTTCQILLSHIYNWSYCMDFTGITPDLNWYQGDQPLSCVSVSCMLQVLHKAPSVSQKRISVSERGCCCSTAVGELSQERFLWHEPDCLLHGNYLSRGLEIP